MSTTTLIVIGLIATALLIWFIAVFNSLVALRVRVQNAWSDIDVQLKRRHDLIPNLVGAVQGYMAHERSTLEAVTGARTRAVASSGGTVADRAQAESVLTGALSNLFAVAEQYPQIAGGREREIAAGAAHFHRKPHCLCATVLQRRSDEVQHISGDIPTQPLRWNVWLFTSDDARR